MPETTPDPKTSRALREALAPLLARARERRVVVGGPFGSAAALVAAACAEAAPALLLVPDVRAAEETAADLASLAPSLTTAVFTPVAEGNEDSPERRAALSQRVADLETLAALRPGTTAVVPAALIFEPSLAAGRREVDTLIVRESDVLEPGRLLERALEAGYARRPLVAGPGEVSMRGDIVDLHPLGAPRPVRIEFFDDRVESLRTFDPESQRSVATLAEARVTLVREADCASSLLDRIPAGILAVLLDPARCRDRLEEAAAAAGDRALSERARRLLLRGGGVDIRPDNVDDGPASLRLETLSVSSLGAGVDGLPAALERLRSRCRRIVLLTESEAEGRRLRSLLRERSLWDEDLLLRRGTIAQGFQWPRFDVAVLGPLELLGKPGRRLRRRPGAALPARVVRDLLEIQPGDYVVHRTHGVARFRETVRLKRERGEEEFLVLEFEGGTLFYLPTSKIDLVQRYVGAGAAPPRLDRIGGASWANKKARVKTALEDLAEELLEVQANRLARPGPPYPHDDPLLADFEASFPHADTADQERAMAEIHRDLSSRRPMDRLLCGDVGFGKTELAVRAAFRVVLGGKQVAVLVPTTLLAEQHLSTFQERFAAYPVRVECLSRFRARARQQEIVEGLRAGTVDVVIGTHRLLSRDVAFRDLGLVVVDEEQRFGVRAKEALKRLRRTVDVLTLTATPIPRTLHMALVGLRDVSSIDQPPPGRLPVHTEIRRFDIDFVRKAIRNELRRGGQVFFVHNRVQSLSRIEHAVRQAVPEATVAVAHGQMREIELERATRGFAEGAIDVLVCTNIIESGLDLPRANTILVDRPDLFGLADLHQLRGRVGRSDRQAYCYLLVPDTPLPRTTFRRLKAIEELSHLGAGYELALEDLEIRGAGNLLGSAQHGHIAAVGYDLYVQMLRAAVARVRGERPPPEPVETDVDLGVEAYLPPDYVPDAGQRMEILRRFGAPDGPPLPEMAAELRDRFGRPPPPAAHLLTLFALKRRLAEIGVRRLLYSGARHLIVEPWDLARLDRSGVLPADRTIWLSGNVAHLALPKDARSPRARLRFVADLLLGGPSRTGVR